MGPHFLALDGLHHSRPQHFQLEVRILQGKRDAGKAAGDKDSHGQCAIFCIPAEDSRVFVLEEPENRPWTRAMSHVNDIVGAGHQLIEVTSKMDRTWVLPDGGQISSGLPV